MRVGLEQLEDSAVIACALRSATDHIASSFASIEDRNSCVVCHG